jgi:uncharacterized RDD family membrane protein YckC
LAGLGSRFCAMLIDYVFIALLILLLILSLVLLGFSVAPWIREIGPDADRWFGWLFAVVLAIVVAMLSGGYFLLFELVMRGQTPGKRSMKIRVIRDDGTPATANEILVRNIVRIVDFLPAGYAVGMIAMFLSPQWKRLGDLAAGTIVVKEGQLDYRAQADKKYELRPAAVSPANAELRPEERRLLTGFLQRRMELLPGARLELAERLARPLFEKYGGQYGDPESYIERLIEGRHYES